MKQYRQKIFYAVVLAFIAFLGLPSNGQVLSKNDLRPDPDGTPDGQILKMKIDVGGGIALDATVEETSKGNGTLSIANLRLRVIDEHDDGAIYEGGMAHVEFADIDADGFKDLLVDGIADLADEKLDQVRSREPFIFVYRFDPKRKEFRLVYKHASFNLDDGPDAKP